MLSEASELMLQRQQTGTKQHILSALKTHFTLPEAQLQTLVSVSEPVDGHFFDVLTKARKIHQDCQVLLGAENQTLGLAIMDQSARTLNTAFQKLYLWIQGEFKTLNLESPQISSPIRRGLRVLAERPTLFQNCLDFFAAARQHILADAFHAALTGSSPHADAQSATKPIELFAHDPLRYVGDMLAWVHSATVSEREALEVLFVSEGDQMAQGIQAGLDSEPWSRPADGEVVEFDSEKALSGLVNRDLDGVGRVLQQRVDQVIQSHEDPTIAYRIGNLVNFYRVTFARLLGQDSALLGKLAAMEESAMRQFRATIKDQVTTLQADLSQPLVELVVPEFLDRALHQLKVLMRSYDTSLVPDSARQSAFQPILAEALDPFLHGCNALARELEEPLQSIFLLNCLLAAKTVLAQFPFTAERLSEIARAIDEQTTKLVDCQHAFFVQASGLHPLLASLASLPDTEDGLEGLTRLSAFQIDALTDTSQRLDDFLLSAAMDAMERLKGLQDVSLAQDITDDAANRFCEDFESVESKIIAADALPRLGVAEKDEDQARLHLRTAFPRTSGEIRVLLT